MGLTAEFVLLDRKRKSLAAALGCAQGVASIMDSIAAEDDGPLCTPATIDGAQDAMDAALELVDMLVDLINDIDGGGNG